jgi:CRISPR-associated exonuclease Cas4
MRQTRPTFREESMSEVAGRVPVALRALEHYAYCPRQCALIHVDQVWSDNEHTVRGRAGHKRADTAPARQERGKLVIRGMDLWSDRLDLHGRADAVEFSPDGTIEPVEYKIGVRHGDAAELQVCAQALCLEDMFDIEVKTGAIWFSATRKREQFELTDELRTRTILTIERIRDLHGDRTLPDAPNDRRCTQCQLLGHCLPDLTSNANNTRAYFESQVLACGS